MQYFLAKTDPETYSIDNLEKEKKTVWDGVRNPQAVRAIRDMRPGDKVFIYHSGGLSAVVAFPFASGILVTPATTTYGFPSAPRKKAGTLRILA